MKKAFAGILLLVLFLGCAAPAQQQNSPAPGEKQGVTVHIKFLDKGSGLLYEKQVTAKKGESLFDAMVENSVPFGYKEFSFGAMVTSISGNEPSDGDYIAIYADGKYASAGVKDMKLEKDANIEFRIEEIKPPA